MGGVSNTFSSPGRTSRNTSKDQISVGCYRVTERDEERDRQISETNVEVKNAAQRLQTIEELLKNNGLQHVENTAESDGATLQAALAREQILLQEKQNELEEEKASHEVTRARLEEVTHQATSQAEEIKRAHICSEEHASNLQRIMNDAAEDQQLRNKEINSLKAEKEELKREKENMLREDANKQEEIRNLKRELKERGSRADVDKRKYESQSADQLERHNESRRQADLQHQQELSAETRRVNKAERDKRDLEEKLRVVQEQHRMRDEQHNAKMEDVMFQFSQSQERIQQLEMELQAGERQRTELREQQRELQTCKALLERERSETQARARDTELRVQEFDAREHQLQTRERQLQVSQQEAHRAQQEVERARQEQNRLRDEQDAIETQRSQELERRAAEFQQQKPRLAAAEKEVKRLQVVVQEQKLLLWKCQSVHKQEMSSQQTLSPGEAQRIFKCREESVARKCSQLTSELLDKAEWIASLEGCVGNVLRFLEERHIRVEDLKASRFLCDNVEEINYIMSLRLSK